MPRASTGETKSAFKVAPFTGTRSICACEIVLTRVLLLETRGIGLRNSFVPPVGGGLEWHERGRPIDVNQRVELLGDAGLEVMALTLGLRSIDYTNRAFEQRCGEAGEPLIIEVQRELRHPDTVQQAFDRSVERGTDNFALRVRIPIGCGGHRAVVRGEADRLDFSAMALAQQLAKVQLAALPHFGGARVAKMR